MSNKPAEDPARARFFTMQAVRLAGVACVIVAILIVSERIAWPQFLGYLLLASGLIAVLVIPTLLARRWRTPR